MIFDLTPTDRHKSFYGKAQVIDDGTTLTLLSYRTKVAAIDKLTGKVSNVNRYSATTLRHLVAFFTVYRDVWRSIYPHTETINKKYIVDNFTD